MFGKSKKLQKIIDNQKAYIVKLQNEIDTIKSRNSVREYMVASGYENRIDALEEEVKMLRGDIDSLNQTIEVMRYQHSNEIASLKEGVTE